MEGEKPMTYTTGQSWYESPKKPHVVSKDAGQTERDKLLSQEDEAILCRLTILPMTIFSFIPRPSSLV